MTRTAAAVLYCLVLCAAAPRRCPAYQTESQATRPPATGVARPEAAFDMGRDRVPVVSLDGHWRFQPGDDPTGSKGWAAPGFDDSSWPLLRSDRPWSEQGYSAMSGFGWYRFTIRLPEDASESEKQFSLLFSPIITSYEVYGEGHRIGACGEMPPSLPRGLFQYHQFPIDLALTKPASQHASQARTLHIAIRVWQSNIWASYIGGGPNGAGNLAGEAGLIAAELSHRQSAQKVIFVDFYVFSIAGAIVGLTVLGLFWFRPKEREYLWFAILLLSLALDAAAQIGNSLYAFLPIPIFDLLDGGLVAINLAAALAFFSIVLRAPRGAVWRITLVLALLSPLTAILYWPGWLSVAASAALQLSLLLPSTLWVLAVLARRAIKRDADALLLLAPAGLYFGFYVVYNLAILLNQAGWIAVPDVLQEPLPLPPFTMHWIVVFDLLFLSALLAFLIRRFSKARQGEERYAGQLEAARQVQQVLLPEAIAKVPGFAVECVYHPAEEVGGDFFQVLPTRDGGLLVVIGDVAGKGLPAAMMVSVLVGAIRAEAAHGAEPAWMLASLNERMFGRSQGKFTTCLCLHIDANGQGTAASAGHLSPYRDGVEMSLEPALPLGLVSMVRYEVTRFTLAPGQRLTIVSDGILEAQSPEGELLGFENTRQLSTRPAAEIAEFARNFGQNDDITVVTIEFRGSPAASHEDPASLALLS